MASFAPPPNPTSLGALMGAGVLHVCYVTRDLTKALDHWYDDIGFSHFTRLGEVDIVGNKAEIAFGVQGELFVELVEPRDDGYLYNTLMRGQPTERPCTFHHYAVRIEDPESATALVAEQGHEIAASGPLGDDFWFGYIDQTRTLGHFVELVWASKAGEAFWDDVRRGAEQDRRLSQPPA